MIQTRKKDGRGGKRGGAGRTLSYPEEGKTQSVTFTTPQRLVARLDAIAKARRVNRSEAITEAIRRYVREIEKREARKQERQQAKDA